MNGEPRSTYLVSPVEGDPISYEEEPQPAATPEPSVSRPLTVGALREKAATAVQRVPLTQRVKEPEVPARLRLKRKTVAFGATINVSQTVEREKDPQPARPTPAPRMSLARVGVGAERGGTRPATGARHQPLAPVARDENRAPGGGGAEERESRREEGKDWRTRLEARIEELEKRQEHQERQHSSQIDRLVKVVTTLTERDVERELVVARQEERIAELEGKRRGRGGGGRRERSQEDESSRTRRRLYSSEEDEEEEGGGRRGEPRAGKRAGGHGLLSDPDALGALERQLASNPVLLRHLQNAIEQDKYEHEYGGRRERRRSVSPPARRGYFDEDEETQPRAHGRGGGASAPAAQRWKDEPRRERLRMTPSGGRGGGGRGTGGGGGGTRRRTDITPSRRRVTERVTMERVHHFDEESDESDGGGGGGVYGRYDSDEAPHPGTLISEEVVDSADFQSVAQLNGRGATTRPLHIARRHQPIYASPRGGAPMITEMDESEDELDRKRREIRERKEARERAGRRFPDPL